MLTRPHLLATNEMGRYLFLCKYLRAPSSRIQCVLRNSLLCARDSGLEGSIQDHEGLSKGEGVSGVKGGVAKGA